MNLQVKSSVAFCFFISIIKVFQIRGHSITTWTRRGGEGVNQMSTIVHVREGGGHENVHMDRIFLEKRSILADMYSHIITCITNFSALFGIKFSIY